MPRMAGTTGAARRRPRHDPRETEREILEAAEALLRERPFREVTVGAIMDATRLKRPAFYAHFRDRYDLVLRVVQQIGDEIARAAEPWLAGTGHPAQDIRASFEALTAVYAEHGPVLRALSEAALSDEQVEATYRGLVQRFIDATAHRMHEEQAAGNIDVRHVDETARALVWLVESYVTETLGGRTQADPATVADVLQQIWLATLYGPNRD
jgi:AcrR family transcriptional regulator